MQNRFGLLVSDVMPIYMIIPRYSHNYAQFCQLLNSNLFTHRRILMLSREATSETYGPRVYLLSYKLSIYFYLHLYFSNLYHKIPKIYLSYHIISIRSHFCKWPWWDWQPLYCVGCEFLFVCVGAWDFWGASYWIDTLVLVGVKTGRSRVGGPKLCV